jgi:hypothetical protein
LLQVFYAKSTDRVRAEMRFKRAVRNTLRLQLDPSSVSPLSELFLGVRKQVVGRTKWTVFCRMASEPDRALLDEVAQMMSAIARCTTVAKVDPHPVFLALLTTGGIDETGPHGPTPRRLIKNLAEEGLITTQSLKRRMQPGERRRHALTGDWRDIVNRLQVAFGGNDQMPII